MATLNETVVSGNPRFCRLLQLSRLACGAFERHRRARRAGPGFVCNQVAYNLIERGVEVEILPQAVAEKIAISPRVWAAGDRAAGGGNCRLRRRWPPTHAGKPTSGSLLGSARTGRGIDRFNRFARERGIHPANLATAWVRYSDAVTCPIVGVSSLRQLEETIQQGAEVELSARTTPPMTDLFTTGRSRKRVCSSSPASSTTSRGLHRNVFT